MSDSIDPDRLALLPELSIDRGSHRAWEDGHCALEIVSWLAGEEYSDTPACACPTIATFVRRWNDDLGDSERDRLLRPLLPLMVGTAGGADLARRRLWRAVDWLVRVHTPAWLDLAGLSSDAAALRALPELAGDSVGEAMPALRAAGDRARRAGAAAGAGAGAVAAAESAAGDAAWAITWAAAADAAVDAAVDAAGVSATAGAALLPTVWALQESAAQLVRDMCAMEALDE